MSAVDTTPYRMYREDYYVRFEGPNGKLGVIYPSMVLTDEDVDDVLRTYQKKVWVTPALLEHIKAEISWLREQAALDPLAKK